MFKGNPLTVSLAIKGGRTTCVGCGVFVALSREHKESHFRTTDTVRTGRLLTVKECTDIAIVHRVLCDGKHHCICSQCSEKSVVDLDMTNTEIILSDKKHRLITYSKVIYGLISNSRENTKSEPVSNRSERVRVGKERSKLLIDSLSEDEWVTLSRKPRQWLVEKSSRLGLKISHLLLLM